MPDPIFVEALERIEKRLSGPRAATVHALVFGFLASAVGLVSASASLVGVMNGVIFWLIFFWCLALLGHGAYTYLHSGAWKPRREQIIEEELVELAQRHSLDPEQWVALHQRLSEDVERRAAPMGWTMGAIAGYAGLWQGLFLVSMVINSTARELAESTNIMAIVMQIIPLIGTLLLALGLVGVNVLAQRRGENAEARAAYLHARYSAEPEKRKRTLEEPVAVGEDGEIALDEEAAARRLRR